MQQGGGIGYDFSTLRPQRRYVKGVGADASGRSSFMDVWDAMCRTIMSAGYRRGAMMATLSCEHPDIEAFIEAKQRARPASACSTCRCWSPTRSCRRSPRTHRGNCRSAARWPRSSRRANCGTRSCARPTPMPSRASSLSTASIAGTICGIARTSSATNPCGEEPLPPYGACLLGSLNLARFVEAAVHRRRRGSTPSALTAIVPDAVRMMDNVIDISRFPLPAAAGGGAEEAPHRPRASPGSPTR